MKKKVVPLLKISGNQSIYYDLVTNKMFVQEFVGPFTEKAGNSYSKSTVWSLVMFIGLIIFPVIAKRLLPIKRPSIYLLVLWLFLLGWGIGFLFYKIFLANSKGNIENRVFNKKEILAIIENLKRAKSLAWIEIIFSVGYVLFFFYSFSLNELLPQDSILVILTGFIVSLLHYSVSPISQRKVLRILKKQLKEGKYDI